MALASCAAAAPEPRVTATLPIIEAAPPKTIYGVDPPVPHDDVSSGQASRSSTPSWTCGEASGMAGFQSLAPLLRACYNRSLQTDPTWSGKLMVRLHVEDTGRASAVSITVASGTANATLESCVKGAVERASYPCVAGDVTVPLMFSQP